ncbi:hypothetical protein J6590_108772 [Homalodisca vitripennis]|nr:hypothetical protein J6590_108772 [Homalodisca vitripennis]
MLKIYFNSDQTKWDTKLTELQLAINCATSEATKNSPYEIMFGNRPNLELTNRWNINDLLDCDVSKPDNLDRFQRTVLNLKKSISANRKRAGYSDKECEHPFKVGSLVYVKTHWLSNKAEKFQAKMANRFCGPYRIIYKLTEVTFIVQDIKDERSVKKVHVSQLKLKY